MVRIAIVLPSMGPGGSERVVSVMTNAWAARGWKVMLVTFDAPGTESYYPIDPRVEQVGLGLPVERLGTSRAAGRVVSRMLRLRRALQNFAPDLVISFLTRTNVITVIAAARTGIPVVVSERNNPKLQVFGPVWEFLRRQTYSRAFGLVTMTKGSMDCFPPEMRRRSWVIQNPVFIPADLKLDRGRKWLTAVGRLHPQKGFDLLLEAFAKIAPTHPDWTLVIWGEGPERTALEAQRDRLGLANQVRLLGVTERPGRWVETADVFVLSSRYEGWGIVLMEAMAAGLPVVSFDCQFGPSDMVTHGVDGLLVKNGDVQALADALARLFDDDELRMRLAAAAMRSSERFSQNRIMAEWDEVVKAATDDRRSGARPFATIGHAPET